jgi:hypothetical protein
MHPTPHPNQVRSACERCRRQKLRCIRPTADVDTNAVTNVNAGPIPSCVRCTRLGFQCESGSQRRVGRPSKREAAAVAIIARQKSQTATPQGLDVVLSSRGSPKQFPRIMDDFATGFISVDWSMGDDAPTLATLLGEDHAASLPVETWSIPRTLTPPNDSNPSSPESHQEVRCPDTVFESLSKLHVELRGLADIWTDQAMHMTFDSFYCGDHDSIKAIAATSAMLSTAQEFVRILRALHRRIGTLPLTMKGPPQQPHGVRSGWTWSSMLTYLDTSSEDGSDSHDGKSAQVASARTLDSPTAFLVISCFVMLIKCVENLFAMTHARLNDLSDGPIRTDLAFSEMMFVDIPIIELSTQGILFAEGLLHLLSQINVLIGFPSRWSGRSIWTGLLSAPKYRDLLNKELGYVEGLWSTRPFRLTETIIMTKDLLQELAMMGYA